MSGVLTCPACRGDGFIYEFEESPDPCWQNRRVKCESCNGRGQFYTGLRLEEQ